MNKRLVSFVLSTALLFLTAIVGYGDSYIVEFEDAAQNAPAESMAYGAPAADARDEVINALQSLRGAPEGIASFAAPESYFDHDYRALYNGVALSLTDEEKVAIEQLPGVKKVHPDVEVKAHLTDSVNIINAPYSWGRYGVFGNGTVIAVIDTGIDYNHPDLGSGFGPEYKVIGGYDFVNNDTDPMDDNSHGTHCAGIAAGDGAVQGVAPKAKLMAVKVLNAGGTGLTSDIIAGIEWAFDPDGNPATDDGADIISMSLGYDGGSPDDPALVALNNMVKAGVVVVVSAGNAGRQGTMTVGFPGCAEEVITVGSSTKTGGISEFSSMGPDVKYGLKPDVLAPGSDIYSTVPGNSYGTKSGTSMAAPHVAGVAALLMEKHPDWSPEDIKSAMMNTADFMRNIPVQTQGGGVVNVPPAMDVEQFVYPPSYSFRMVDNPLPGGQLVTDKAVFTVKNNSDIQVIYETMVVWESNPGGFDTQVPYLVSVPAHGQTTFEVDIQWNNQILQKGYYSGRVELYNAVGQSLVIPLFFAKKDMEYAVSGPDTEGRYLLDVEIPFEPAVGIPVLTDPKGNTTILPITQTNIDPAGWGERNWRFEHYFTPDIEGRYDLQITAADISGKGTFLNGSFDVDLTAPEAALSASVVDQSILITLDVDENVSDTWEALSHSVSDDAAKIDTMSSAFDSNGRLHMAWGMFNLGNFRYRYRDANGSWGPVQVLGNFNCQSPQVIVDKDDNVHILYWQNRTSSYAGTTYYLNHMVIDGKTGTVTQEPVEYPETANRLTDYSINTIQKVLFDSDGKLHYFGHNAARNFQKYYRFDLALAVVEEVRDDLQAKDVIIDKNDVLHLVGSYQMNDPRPYNFYYTSYDYKNNALATKDEAFTFYGDGRFVINVVLEQDDAGMIYVFGVMSDFYTRNYRLHGKTFDGETWRNMGVYYTFNRENAGIAYYDTSRTLDVLYSDGKIGIALNEVLIGVDPKVVYLEYDIATDRFGDTTSITQNREEFQYKHFNLLESPLGGKILAFDSTKRLMGMFFNRDVSRIIEQVESPKVIVTGPSGDKAVVSLDKNGTSYTATVPVSKNGTYTITAEVGDSSFNMVTKVVELPVQALDYEVNLAILDWETGFQGDFTVTNLSDQPIENWVLEFDWHRELTFVWDGNSTKEGDHYTIYAPSWDTTIPAGGSIKFGVIGNPGNVDDEPLNYSLTGE